MRFDDDNVITTLVGEEKTLVSLSGLKKVF